MDSPETDMISWKKLSQFYDNKNNKNISKNERTYRDIKTKVAHEQDWDGTLATNSTNQQPYISILSLCFPFLYILMCVIMKWLV